MEDSSKLYVGQTVYIYIECDKYIGQDGKNWLGVTVVAIRDSKVKIALPWPQFGTMELSPNRIHLTPGN